MAYDRGYGYVGGGGSVDTTNLADTSLSNVNASSARTNLGLGSASLLPEHTARSHRAVNLLEHASNPDDLRQGVGDAGAVLTAAIAEASAQGGPRAVVIPAGTYRFDTTVNLDQTDIRIFGSAGEIVTLQQYGDIHIFTGLNGADTNISNFRFVGRRGATDGVSTSAKPPITAAGIDTGDRVTFHVNYCTFDGFGQGITAGSVCQIIKRQAFNSAELTLYMDGVIVTANNLNDVSHETGSGTINSVIFEASEGEARNCEVYCAAGSHFSIPRLINCKSWNVVRHGAIVNYNTITDKEWVVRGCEFRNFGSCGVYINQDSSRNIIPNSLSRLIIDDVKFIGGGGTSHNNLFGGISCLDTKGDVNITNVRFDHYGWTPQSDGTWTSDYETFDGTGRTLPRLYPNGAITARRTHNVFIEATFNRSRYEDILLANCQEGSIHILQTRHVDPGAQAVLIGGNGNGQKFSKVIFGDRFWAQRTDTTGVLIETNHSNSTTVPELHFKGATVKGVRGGTSGAYTYTTAGSGAVKLGTHSIPYVISKVVVESLNIEGFEDGMWMQWATPFPNSMRGVNIRHCKRAITLMGGNASAYITLMEAQFTDNEINLNLGTAAQNRVFQGYATDPRPHWFGVTLPTLGTSTSQVDPPIGTRFSRDDGTEHVVYDNAGVKTWKQINT